MGYAVLGTFWVLSVLKQRLLLGMNEQLPEGNLEHRTERRAHAAVRTVRGQTGDCGILVIVSGLRVLSKCLGF